MSAKVTRLSQLVNREEDDFAVKDDAQSLSWGELDIRSHALIRGLQSLGLKELDHISLIISNRVEFLEAYLATIRGGFTQTPIKTSWVPAEVSYIIQDANSKAVITDTDAAREAAAHNNIPVVDLDLDFAGWLASQDQTPIPAGLKGYRVPYTSGTTGKPKGVERITDVESTFEEWATSNAVGAAALELPRDGWHLMVSQMFHGAPMTFGVGAFFQGAPMRIMSHWQPERFGQLLQEGVTATIMVPTMFRQLLNLPEAEKAEIDFSQLKLVLHGGESCPVAVKRQMIDWWGPVFREYYGFTEGGMTMASSEEWLDKPGTVGLPIGGMTLSVIGDDGTELAPGQEGSLYFKRPEGAFFKYANAKEKTEAAHLPDGSFTVGDIGWVDEDGYLYISGRSAELIVAAGVNIYPAEIEEVLLEVKGVTDAAVVAGPDPDRGEQPVAFLTLSKDADEPEVLSACQTACKEQLAGYKLPRKIIVRDEIPRDPTGKTLRIALRSELWE